MSTENLHTAVIKVIGVGGGGCNAVNRMYNDGVQGVEFIVCNTDAQVLLASPVENKIMIGRETSKGLGAGANPKVGHDAAKESEEEIRNALKGSDLIFIAAGMGGGTGTGAAPVVAKIARETGALVVAAVSKPFVFEGSRRESFAIEGIAELKKNVDSIIVVSNNRVLDLIGEIPFDQSFKEADGILKQAVQTITDLIAVPSLINLDFADVNSVLRGKGNALFGIGIGEGDDKAVQAANKAITSSLLESSIRGAKDAIINVTGGPDCTANDAYDAVDIITQAAGSDLNIIFGFATNKEMAGQLIVSIIATGFDEDQQYSQQPTIQNYQQQPQVQQQEQNQYENNYQQQPQVQQQYQYERSRPQYQQDTHQQRVYQEEQYRGNEQNYHQYENVNRNEQEQPRQYQSPNSYRPEPVQYQEQPRYQQPVRNQNLVDHEYEGMRYNDNSGFVADPSKKPNFGSPSSKFEDTFGNDDDDDIPSFLQNKF